MYHAVLHNIWKIEKNPKFTDGILTSNFNHAAYFKSQEAFKDEGKPFNPLSCSTNDQSYEVRKEYLI
jgi:hypothetical protein